MRSTQEYFSSFFNGLGSLLKGMSITLREFFTPKTTEKYPENRATLKMFDRFRGELTMPHNERNEHHCVACGICEMNCPNDTIRVESEMVTTEDGKRKRYWCGICMTTVAVCIASYVCGAVPIRPLLLSRPTNTPFLPVRNWYSN